jgi:hypothetical protein
MTTIHPIYDMQIADVDARRSGRMAKLGGKQSFELSSKHGLIGFRHVSVAVRYFPVVDQRGDHWARALSEDRFYGDNVSR